MFWRGLTILALGAVPGSVLSTQPPHRQIHLAQRSAAAGSVGRRSLRALVVSDEVKECFNSTNDLTASIISHVESFYVATEIPAISCNEDATFCDADHTTDSTANAEFIGACLEIGGEPVTSTTLYEGTALLF